MARMDQSSGSVDLATIEHGWDVFGPDDKKVGDVAEVGSGYIVVSRGWLFPTERYIPASAIIRVAEDRVFLNVSKDEIDERGWDHPPTDSAGSGTLRTEDTITERPSAGMRTEREAVVERPAGRSEREARVGDEGHRTIDLREEELRARKERVDVGEVELNKEVVAEQRTIDVPVTREEVVVERHAVDRKPTDAPISEGETIRVPLREERVDVEKRAVVYEEVDVAKRQVQETQWVSDTVRREELRVENEGDTRVRPEGASTGWNDVMRTWRQAWEGRHASSGRRWEDVEPFQHYGYEMSSDPRYRDRDWNDVEPELRRDYSDWSRRNNYRGDDSAWDEMKENVRESWQEARSRSRR